jgi:hypothetical protein
MNSARQRASVQHSHSREPYSSRETPAVVAVAALALAVRIYLSLTSYCISGDGIAYLTMARQFAAGEWRLGLRSVFSPLYPLLVSVAHLCVTNWETAGNLVSTLLGTAAVVSVYLMTRQAFGRREVALGAAILMAVHPEMAAYSASVRTEAGYALLTTATCWLLLKALDARRVMIAGIAGMGGGLAYLYRTEGIGFLPLGILLFAGGLVWHRTSRLWAIAATASFATIFVLIAGPYIGYLRISSGHWSVGREFAAAMMYGMGDVARNGDEWRRLGYSAAASPFAAIFASPSLYAEKVGEYFVVSIYNFAQGLQPLLMVLLGFGLWSRGRAISGELKEAFLAAVVLFYFCGFVLSYTGTRFMIHLIPFTFGWVIVGIIAVSDTLARWFSPNRKQLAHLAVPAVVALLLLPRTLWPIGYDMRGLRYAGEDIAKMAQQKAQRPPAVATRDGRAAYYAGARLVELPAGPVDLCGWLASQQRVDYLIIGNRDERAFDVTPAASCLELLKRYPRDGSRYYDLYAIRPAERSGLSSGDAPAGGAQ